MLAVVVEPRAAAGAPWWLYAAIVGGVLAVGLLVLLFAIERKPRAELTCHACGRVILPDWESCLFCHVQVIREGGALSFVSGPLGGRSIPLDSEVTTIGSVAGNTVVLLDTGVSRKHVGIRRVEGGFELADLGSTNGVYVNGEKVARRRLSAGDVIRLGTTEIVFKS